MRGWSQTFVETKERKTKKKQQRRRKTKKTKNKEKEKDLRSLMKYVSPRAYSTCPRVQPPSKLRSANAHTLKKGVPWRCDLYKRSRKTLPSGEPLYLMKTKMQNIRKVCFCTKLFENTIFTMYEWWRFQRYRICLKNLKIRISIEKLNFFLVHLEGSVKKK